MERADDALLRPVAFALPLEIAGAQRPAKLDRDRLGPRPPFSNGQRPMGAVNGHRHGQRREAFQQDAD